MIREIELGGKKILAVILDDFTANDLELCRESLLDVTEAAMQNTEILQNGHPGVCQFSDCIRLARALEPPVQRAETPQSPLSVYMQHIAHANHIIFKETTDNIQNENQL